MTVLIKHLVDKVESNGDEIKEIHAELKLMNRTLIKNTEQLKIHIEGVVLARQQNEDYRKEMDSRVKPLEETNIVARGYIKLGMALIGIPAGAYYIIQIFKFIASL